MVIKHGSTGWKIRGVCNWKCKKIRRGESINTNVLSGITGRPGIVQKADYTRVFIYNKCIVFGLSVGSVQMYSPFSVLFLIFLLKFFFFVPFV